jgi:hypothetical protein
MKVWLSLVIAVAALVLAVRDQDGSGAERDPFEQGARRVDSYLQEGLSEGTHEVIQKGTHEYTGWARGFKDDFDGALE